jgi:hypothetical protein
MRTPDRAIRQIPLDRKERGIIMYGNRSFADWAFNRRMPNL